ncbi:DNA damage-binding protein 2-like [Macrobrachium rosenbergii]|uniref:DNA damage-binding protein 2-like n=1 Tax=Macrobrachium rosenbergii TaxID=79674 RepID=UPI0034D3BCB0
MAPKRSRNGKQPNYREDSDSSSDDDFELPHKVSTPKCAALKKNAQQARTCLKASTSKKNGEISKASSSNNKDSQKAKKNKHNKENVPKKRENVPWIDRQALQQKNGSINFSSCHLLHFLRNRSFGTTPPFWQDQSLNKPLMNVNQRLKVYKVFMEFDRRVTVLEWHPKSLNIVAVGAKSGDIVLWDYEHEKNLAYINGTGANGSIQAMKFDCTSPNLVYTASVNGTVACHDFSGRAEEQIYLNTWDLNHWYTSLDLLDKHTFMVGDNKGHATILTTDGNEIWKGKLHKQKITHLECCPSNSNYIISASVDRTMKVWDVRSLKSQKSCLYSLEHNSPINSAYFSPSGGCVLTTDQKKELRVYAGPSFTLMQIIPHPHRHFQHLTPIKAIWHPLRDIIVVGRYPDPEFPTYTEGELKSIDFFDAASGELLHQHVTKALSNKIVSLNVFSRSGDQMLSAAGLCAFLWRPEFPSQSQMKEARGKDKPFDDDDDDADANQKDQNSKNNRKKQGKYNKKNDFKVVRGEKKKH